MKPEAKHSFLVVDDEPDVLDSMFDLFRRDFHVLRANNAEQAKSVLRQQPVHIVMSDQRMPGVTGLELLREVKEEFPDTVRLIFTAYTDIQVVMRAINEGEVFRYVTKGCEPDELRTVVRQAADYYDLLTERKQLIADLQRANADLRTANALKAAFLDVASHELGTPVTIIKGMTELAEDQLAQPGGEPFRGFVRVVQSGTKRLERLVANMVKLLQAGSYRADVELSAVNCFEMLDRVRGQVAPFLARRKQTLAIRVEPEYAVIHVDQGKMHDVVWNLLMNAIKFSPDGAVIELTARTGDARAVTVEVADAGAGIAESDLPHIFEPFFSTFDTLHHSSGSFEYGKRGLGMGLAIVRKFVEMHGGTIRVSARKPRGTSFVIELPGHEGRPCTT